MIRIEFGIKDAEGNETILTDMKLPSNPFKIGDKLNLKLNSLKYHELIGYKDTLKESIKTDYETLKSTAHFKTAVLVEESFFMDIDMFHDNRLTIVYLCEIID